MSLRMRRKRFSITFIVVLLCSLMLSSGIAAAQAASVAKQNNEVTVFINGVKQKFSQPAVAVNGRTLVPLRGIFEALGAKVEWNAADQVARGIKGDIEVLVQLGNKSAYVNGTKVELDVPAQSINGSTMVPLRFISESLGAEVKWDDATDTAYIISDGSVNQDNPGSGVEQGQVQYGSDYWRYGVKVKVSHGDHDYGVKSQKEYDESMKIVDQALKNELGSIKFGGDRYHEFYLKYLEGDRASNYENGSDEHWKLTIADNNLSDLVKTGIDNSIIIEVNRLQTLALNYTAKADSIKGDGTPRSIYDALVRFDDDCDSTAQTISAFFDAKGYNTAIIAGKGHAEAYVKLNNTWFELGAGTFKKVSSNLENLSFRPGVSGSTWLMSNPTIGKTASNDVKQQANYGSDYWRYGVKILVRYGDHDYGVRSQKEYDESMKIVDQALKNDFDSIKFGGDRYNEYFLKYVQGDRASNYENGSDAHWKLTIADNKLSDLVKTGVDSKIIMEVSRLQDLAISYTAKASSISGDGSPRSIYDTLVRLDDDCDSFSQTLSAFFDAKGYSTAVVAGKGHAESYVKLNNTWFELGAGTFKKVSNIENLSFRPGVSGSTWLMSKPTF